MSTPQTVEELCAYWNEERDKGVNFHVRCISTHKYYIEASHSLLPQGFEGRLSHTLAEAVADIHAKLLKQYPEPEPEPFTTTFVFDRSGGIYHSEMCNAEGRPADMKIGIHIGPEPTVVWHTAAELKAAMDTHEAVKAWEAAARKADTEPFWYACRKGGIATRQYDTILAALIAEFGGEAALEAKS